MKNLGGRPKKSPSQKKSMSIKFSCTEQEYNFLERHSKNSGHLQLAAFLHKAIFSVIENGKFRYIEPAKIDHVFLSNLSAISNNINQAMHLLHETKGENPNDWEYFDQELNRALKIVTNAAKFAFFGLEKESKLHGWPLADGNS